MGLKKNKRGDIPITILVIGVFIVCSLAIASFLYSSYLIGVSFEDVGTMQNANVQIETNSLNVYNDEIYDNRFAFSWDFDFVKEVLVFSVDYSKGD